MTRSPLAVSPRHSLGSVPLALRRLLRLLLLATLLTLAIGCATSPESESREARSGGPVAAVEVLEARSGGEPQIEQLSGVVRARNQVTIRPEISATVTRVLVESGQTVTVGQALVELNTVVLDERLRQAEAAHRQARATLAEATAQIAQIEAQVSRTRVLEEQGLSSAMSLEVGEAQLAAAQAREEGAQAEVDETASAIQERRDENAKATVRAPVAGHIGQRNVEIGMLVDPSSTLFVVGDFTELVVEVPLTEKMLAEVKTGTPVDVRADVLGDQPVRAAISRVSPFLERNSFSTTAEIDLSNSDGRLRPGMFVTVDLLMGQTSNFTQVPTSSIWSNPTTGDSEIFVVTDAAAFPGEVLAGEQISERLASVERRAVEILSPGNDVVGVSGLEPGEWVVAVGQHLLHTEIQRAQRSPTTRQTDGETAAATSRDGAPVTLARIRGVQWERVLALGQLQREDLLRGFLEKQRIVAAALGSEIPDDPAVVDQILAAEDASPIVSGGTS